MTAVQHETHALSLPHEMKAVALPEAFLLRAGTRQSPQLCGPDVRTMGLLILLADAPARQILPAVRTAEAEPPAAWSQLEGLFPVEDTGAPRSSRGGSRGRGRPRGPGWPCPLSACLELPAGPPGPAQASSVHAGWTLALGFAEKSPESSMWPLLSISHSPIELPRTHTEAHAGNSGLCRSCETVPTVSMTGIVVTSTFPCSPLTPACCLATSTLCAVAITHPTSRIFFK